MTDFRNDEELKEALERLEKSARRLSTREAPRGEAAFRASVERIEFLFSRIREERDEALEERDEARRENWDSVDEISKRDTDLASLRETNDRLKRFETYVCQVIAMGNQADLTVESLPR